MVEVNSSIEGITFNADFHRLSNLCDTIDYNFISNNKISQNEFAPATPHTSWINVSYLLKKFSQIMYFFKKSCIVMNHDWLEDLNSCKFE